MRVTEDWKMNQDNLEHGTVEMNKITKKSLRDLKRFSVTQNSDKDLQLIL